MQDPTGNSNNRGVAKVLRLDARWHQNVVDVVVAECTMTSSAKCPECAILRHGQGVIVTAGHLEHWRHPKCRLCPHQRLCQAVGFVTQAHVHTVAVMLEGGLWVWGEGEEGQLGLGDEANRLTPTLVGAEAAFGGSPVLTVACFDFYSPVVTKDSALWTFGNEDDGAHGQNDCNTRLVPMCIEAQHFGNAKIVSVAVGVSHSAAVTEEGTLYTWGHASGLGHADRKAT